MVRVLHRVLHQVHLYIAHVEFAEVPEFVLHAEGRKAVGKIQDITQAVAIIHGLIAEVATEQAGVLIVTEPEGNKFDDSKIS